MTPKKIILTIVAVVVLAVIGYYVFSMQNGGDKPLDPTPQNATLSGTYVCLPHLDTTGPQTEECAFGLKTDDGSYYAVNFGQASDSLEQFQSGAHITAEGFIVIKEALSSNQWQKYNMKGIFTITKMVEATPVQGKLNINTVCEGALSYMTFPDSKSAETFVAECKEGKHPEVIEQYKKQMNLGDGATI